MYNILMASTELTHKIIQTANFCCMHTPKIDKTAFLLEVKCKYFFLAVWCWYCLEAFFPTYGTCGTTVFRVVFICAVLSAAFCYIGRLCDPQPSKIFFIALRSLIVEKQDPTVSFFSAG